MTLEPGGWLCVEGVEVECTIGVTERERATKQRILINLKMKVAFGKVAMSDAIPGQHRLSGGFQARDRRVRKIELSAD